MAHKKTPSGQLFEAEVVGPVKPPRAKKEKKAKQERLGICSDCGKSFPISELHVPKHHQKMVCPSCYMAYISQVATYASQVTHKDD